MKKHLHLAAVLVALAVAGLGQAASAPTPDVPAKIAVPAGHKAFLLGHATGVQIYACDGDEWRLLAPRASLYDDRGKLLTTHFGGPTWQAKDGSFVVGRVVDREPAAGTIPWLLLEAATASPEGRLSGTAYIQRIATTGGVSPAASTCDASAAGTTAEVAYTADYVFWKAKGS